MTRCSCSRGSSPESRATPSPPRRGSSRGRIWPGCSKGKSRWYRRPRRCWARCIATCTPRSEEHTSELQSLAYLVCRLLLEKKKKTVDSHIQRLNRNHELDKCHH